MKKIINNKHKNVLFKVGTQGIAKMRSLAVVSGLVTASKAATRPFKLAKISGLPSSTHARPVALSLVGFLSQIGHRVSSTSRARALSLLGALFNTFNQCVAGLTSRARALSQLCTGFVNTKVHRIGLASRARALSLFGALLVTVLSVAGLVLNNSDRAQAATSDTLNFQGRLLTNTGGLVPDGDYNIEFNLYNVPTGGSTLWTEDRLVTNTEGVTVRNGYFSVYLGELDAFGALDWDQELYLGMTIRGTTNCAWGSCIPADSEMTPRFKLSAVPYAFRAANVGSSSTNAVSTNSNGVSISSGDALGATSNSGNITIDSGTATGTAGQILLGTNNASALTIGRAGVTTTIQGSVSLTGAGTALTVTNNALFNGDITLGSDTADTLTVEADALFNGTLTVSIGDTFINSGATLNTAVAISDVAAGGDIGTAATTVDVATTFNVNQTTASQALTLPTPTDTTAGRIVYVNNVGSASFTMYGNPVAAGSSSTFIWNGSSWVQTISFTSTGVDTIGALDGGTPSANGASISGTTLYLQSASATQAGLVSTSAQTFAGAKTFNDAVTITNSITNTGNAQTINLTLVDDTDADTVSGLVINATSVNTGDFDTILGLNINNLTGQNATVSEIGLFIGSGWDANIWLADTSSEIVVADGGVINFSDGTNSLLTITDNGTTGNIAVSGTLQVAALGTTDTANFVCRNSSNILAGCNFVPLSSSLTDNIADALDIQEGTNNYININTTDSSENISFGNTTTNPSYSFLGSGTLTVSGDITTDGVLTVNGNGTLATFGDDTGNVFISIDSSSTGTATIDFDQNNGTDYIQFDNNTNTFTWKAGGVNQLNVSSTGLNVLTNASVDGNLTVGDAAGDTLTVNAGSIQFANNFVSCTAINTDASGNLGCDTSTYLTSANAFLQNGNSFTANAVLGTNDAYDLELEVAGNTVVTLDNTDGSATFQNTTDSATAFQVQNAAGAGLFTVNSIDNAVRVNALIDANNGVSTPAGGAGQYENHLVYSQQFNQASWTKSNVTSPTADTISDPNGVSSAESLATTASGGYVQQNSTTSVGSTHTFSVWLKTASGTQSVDLRIDGTGSGTGTARTVTATTSWQRFYVTQDTSAFTGNVRVRIYPGTTSGTGTVHAWGAQLNPGSTPYVYINVDENPVVYGNSFHTDYGWGLVSNGALTLNDTLGKNIVLSSYTGGSDAEYGRLRVVAYGTGGYVAEFRDQYNSIFRVGDTTTASIFDQGGLIISDDLQVDGNTTIGNASGDTLTVNAGSIQFANNFVSCTAINTDASGNLGCDTSTYLTSANAFLQNGNSFTANAVLGTNDAFSLIFETNNTTALTIDTSQNATFAGNLVVAATKSLTLTGGNTASRPGAPSAGELYYDTDTNTLLVYNGSKWVADRGEYIIVATSSSSQASQDVADYVGDGTDDQVEINSAISAANALGGAKVMLLEGNYSIGGTISIVSNTEIIGAGIDATTLTIEAGHNADLDVFSESTNPVNWAIRDLTINMNDTAQSSGTYIGIDLANTGVDNVTRSGIIDGIEITNFTDTGSIGIRSNDDAYLAIQNSIIVNGYDAIQLVGTNSDDFNAAVKDNIIADIDNRGVYVNQRYDVQIQNNRFDNMNGTDATDAAISLNNDLNTIIESNNIVNGGASGVYSTGTSQNINISGNQIDGMVTGISGQFDNSSIVNNTIVGTGCDGIGLTASDNTTVTGNTIKNAGCDAIWLGNDVAANTAIVISSNVVDTSGDDGIDVGDSSDVTVVGNSVFDAGGDGILLDGITRASVNGNRISDSGSVFAGGDSIRTSGISSRVSINNNVIYDSGGTTNIAIHIDGATVSNSYISDNIFTGTFNAEILDTGTNTVYGGQLDASDNYVIQPTGTIELLANTNITGTLDVTGAATFDGNVTIGDAAGDTLVVNAGTVTFANVSNGSGLSFTDASFQNCILSTNASGVLTCSSSGSVVTLQAAYTGGNTITATDTEGDIDLTVSEATNFSVDITGTGNFLVQDGGTNVFSIADGGAAVFQNTTNSTNAFRINQADGTALFTADTTNYRVGIGTDAPVADLELWTDITVASNRSLKWNGYWDGANDVYLADGSAVQQWQDETSDFYRFYAAAGGLQGNNITWQEAFAIDLNSASLGDVTFDSGTLYVDSSANQVNIGNSGSLYAEGGIYSNSEIKVNTDGSSTAAPRIIGAYNFSAGEAIRWEFGDSANAIQNSWGGALQVAAYHTIQLYGNRNNGAALAYSTDSTNAVEIYNGEASGDALVIVGAASQTGNYLTVSANGGGDVLTVASDGAVALQNSSNSANAFRVNNAAGTSVLNVDTTNFAVDLASTRYQTVTNATCAVNCSITQSNVDTNAAIIVEATAAGLDITLPDPTDTTAGRLVYVTAANGSEDFTLIANGGGTNNEIAMRENTTATMIWNGSDWTAAGASSSTTLQAAYDNTLTSAGGAEIVLNNSATSNGLTVRNNDATPIIGSIFEAQTSIGSNLFSVNNNAVEYAVNGGAEDAFASDWSATPDGGTVTRYTTQGDYIATGVGSVSVVTAATADQGAENTLSTALTPNLRYSVSFAVRGASSFNTLDVFYSPDGTTTGEVACTTGETVSQGKWRRVICTFDAPSSGITSSNAILIRQSDATARTFYIENLSVTVKADVNHVVDGDVDSSGSFATNWNNEGAATTSYESSVIYNTSGSAQVDTTAAAGDGISNNLSITPSVSTKYLVTFYAQSSNTFDDIRVRYTRDGGSNYVSCTDYNTQSVSTSSWTLITCLLETDSTTATDANLVIDQPTATARTFYIDGVEMTLNENTASSVQIGGGNLGGPTTLLTLDRSAGPPVGANNDAYLGSMYYDTTTGRIQCYEAGGWGTCGAPPDNIVNLNPEYAGSVLNGGGIGTMQADVCANESGVLQVNSTLCGSGEARSFYTWTSPQATQQTYSIYVTYQLPSTFDGFASDDTVTLTGRVSNTSNAAVTYEMFRSESGSITKCGTGETTVATTANTWQTVGINGNEATGCGFTSNSANAFVIFKINLKANSNADAYVSTLSFTTTGR